MNTKVEESRESEEEKEQKEEGKVGLSSTLRGKIHKKYEEKTLVKAYGKRCTNRRTKIDSI
jgi:hypothetical protein